MESQTWASPAGDGSAERSDATRHINRALVTDHGSAQRAESLRRLGVRFVVAGVLSLVGCGAVWRLVPRTLIGPTDIVGYPTFANYAYEAPFWAWRITVYLFPATLIAAYSLLAWWGPLRRRERVERVGVRPIDAPVPPTVRSGPAGSVAGAAARLAIPMLVVAWEASTRSGRYDVFAAAIVLAFLVIVGVCAVAVAWWVRRRESTFRWRQVLPRLDHAGGGHPFWTGLSWATGVGGSAAALLGLGFVSAHTAVVAAGVRYPEPWFPWWVAGPAAAGVVGWAAFRTRRGWSAALVERRLLVVTGAVGIFLVTAAMVGSRPRFEGFDDSLELAGSALVGRGLMPWRDIMFMHGLFPDVLRGTVTRAVFGDTAWALPAALSMVFGPLTWVGVYLLAAWVSRSNLWVLTAVFVLAAVGYVPHLETRFLSVPLSLIVLGVALARRTRGWAVGLILVLLVQAVLVPETSFLVLPALACVVAADVVHRAPGMGIWSSLRMTRWCAVAGVGALALLAAILASFGALAGFVQYYVIFGQDHNLTGAIRPSSVGGTERREIITGVVLILVTVWMTAARVRRRGDWLPVDWVTLTAAGFTALYGEKFLGHFDRQHVWQFGTVELSLIALWVAQAGNTVNGLVSRLTARSATRVGRPGPAGRRTGSGRWHWPRRPTVPILSLANGVTVVIIVVVLATFPSIGPTMRSVNRHYLISSDYPVTPFPRAGFYTPVGLDVEMVRDLDTMLTAFAGSDQPVFDMTNSPGYVDYLLGRRAGTRFDPVVLAIPADAQRITIDELRRSRPPVVVFDSGHMGVPVWDGIANNVRHYLISQFILDGWIPIARTHGNLILLRKDLWRSNVALPPLLEPPVTTDLYFGRPCAWGFAPGFLSSAQQSPTLNVPVRAVGPYEIMTTTGWAIDPATGTGATSVAGTIDGVTVGTVAATQFRPGPSFTRAPVAFTYQQGFRQRTDLSYFVLSRDGNAYPLAGSAPTTATVVTAPDGRRVPVIPRVAGGIDRRTYMTESVGQVDVPSGTDLSHYPLATVETSGAPLGGSRLELTDQVGVPSHTITAAARTDNGPSLSVRVGSCTQWRGFNSSRPLYLIQHGGTPVTSVTLSAVRG